MADYSSKLTSTIVCQTWNAFGRWCSWSDSASSTITTLASNIRPFSLPTPLYK